MASQKEKDGKWTAWQNLKEEAVQELVDKRTLQGVTNFKGQAHWQKPNVTDSEVVELADITSEEPTDDTKKNLKKNKPNK